MGSTASIALANAQGAPEVYPRALLVLSGESQGRVLPLLPRGLSIGRSPRCDLCIGRAGDGTSRLHAEISRTGRYAAIEDRSRNGLLVNGRRCRRRMLADGDLIKIGRTVLKVLADPSEVAFYRQIGGGHRVDLPREAPAGRSFPRWEPGDIFSGL